MLHASLAFLWPDGMQNYALLGEGVSAPLSKAALPMLRPTADGYISISFIQDREFESLCRMLGREELLEDERYATAGPRARNAQPLQESLDPVLRTFTTATLAEQLAEADVPHATIHQDPQVIANDLIFEMDHHVAGPLRQPRPIGDFSCTPSEIRRGAPAMGEHTRDVATEAGYSAKEIQQLLDRGILIQAEG
jgi:crotonobetainyl-CoA:carnitine CoA-transferase CaiB-like acyl-CoA transferase